MRGTLKPPTWRCDRLDGRTDLVETIARLFDILAVLGHEDMAHLPSCTSWASASWIRAVGDRQACLRALFNAILQPAFRGNK